MWPVIAGWWIAGLIVAGAASALTRDPRRIAWFFAAGLVLGPLSLLVIGVWISLGQERRERRGETLRREIEKRLDEAK